VEAFESRQRALALCWAELLPKHREVLAAHYASGCSMREIAESRQMGVSAVKVMMLRLRQGLASCIGQKLASEVVR
jgi:DNA-directed RNA polymerase specialized sigma24 family protein